jgi:hypothetical protein
MLQPGGAIFVDKGGLYNHSTMTCFVFDDGGLYILSCGHCLVDSKNDLVYEDKALSKAVGAIDSKLIKGTESSEDMGLARVIHPKSLTEANFQVATTARDFAGVKSLGQAGPAPLFFPGSKSREKLQIARSQQVKVGRVSGDRFFISAAPPTKFRCMKGDSGTPVYSNGPYIVGMFHMGSGVDKEAGEEGIAITISHVLDTLGVKLATWQNRGQWQQTSSNLVEKIDTAGIVWNVPLWDKK